MFFDWYRKTFAALGVPLALLLLVGALPITVRAQAQTPEDPVLVLRRAEVTFQEGDYEGAVAMLEPFLKRTDLTKEQTAKGHELLAFCYDALDKEDKIRQNVKSLYELNRKYNMRSEWMDDRMQRIVAEVQAELAEQDQKPATPPATPAQEQKPATPPDRMTADEAGGGGGKSKTIYYVAGGAAAVALIAVLLVAGGGGDEEGNGGTLDTLPLPPARPTNR